MLADTSAVTLLSMLMLVSFCPMVRPPRRRISVAVALRDDPLGQTDELGAHLEVRALHLAQVDVETDDIAFQLEGDHASPIREAVHLADGEDAGALQRLQDLRQARLLGRPDEEDLDPSGCLRSTDPPDLHVSFQDRLPRERLLEDGPEGVLAQDRDDEGRAERMFLGPLHELGKVIEERRLDLVRGGSWSLRGLDRSCPNEQQKAGQRPRGREPHQRHRATAYTDRSISVEVGPEP